VQFESLGATREKPECYDLDVFFHLAPNKDGKPPTVLLYPKCISDAPRAPELLSRAQVVKRLRSMGMNVILLDKAEFENLAANAINIEPGVIMFGRPVRAWLTAKLTNLGYTVIQATGEAAKALSDTDSPTPWSVHCMTFEIPYPRVDGDGGPNADSQTAPPEAQPEREL
jgi:hypothetical protein